MKVKYFNGSFCGTSKVGSNGFGQVVNAIIVAKSDGMPFRGMPEDMARDALFHICGMTAIEMLVPVIIDSSGGSDTRGWYTNEVVFQAVC